MRRRGLLLAGVALGAVASQAGHLVAYGLRYGRLAAQLQSAGAHEYFPALVKTGLGLAATFALLAVVAVALSRLLAGRRLSTRTAPSYVRLVAMLFSFQLTCFFVQETIEMASGAPATSAPALLLWGAVGQLPAALLAALALRWLAVRVVPAVVELLGPTRPVLRIAPQAVAPVASIAPVAVPAFKEPLNLAFTRRGPPL